MNSQEAYAYLLDFCSKTLDLWDGDYIQNKDSKVGKRLQALSGTLVGYDAKLDEAMRILNPSNTMIIDADEETRGITDNA